MCNRRDQWLCKWNLGLKEIRSMQGREIMILQSRIAALEQYNQYLLERNELLKGLVKKYTKFLEDLLK